MTLRNRLAFTPTQMQKLTNRQAQELRRYARTYQKILAPFDQWPRDERARARRDRIEALLVQIESGRTIATTEDPTAMMRVVEELAEWLSREFDFVQTYPVLDVPADWTRPSGLGRHR